MIAIVPGHGWKGTTYDTGAVSPAGWHEAAFVRDVAILTSNEHERRRGFPIWIRPVGPYGARLSPLPSDTLVVHLHADAVEAETGPDITRVWYWSGNDKTKRLAGVVAAALNAVTPWDVQSKAAEPDVDWHQRARNVLGASRHSALLVELGFTDGAKGRTWLPAHAGELGIALAQGLAEK